MTQIDDSKLYCEVRTSKGVFRDWTSVTVNYSAERSYMRFFQLELAEVTPPGGQVQPTLLGQGGAGAALMQRLLPGDRASIYLAGQPVIVDGYIKVRQAAYDANRHAVQVTGIAKSGNITKVSVDVPGGQFRNYTLSAIASRVLQPLGVGFSLVNPPSGADLPFRNVIVAPGETIGGMIVRLARQRGCWVWTDVDGTINAGNPPGSGSATLEEGRNIISASSYIEDPQAEFALSRSQTSGSDQLWGRNSSEISAKASIPGSRSGAGMSVITLAEAPNTQKELQTRTNFEVQAIMADIHRDVITHRGWLRPTAAALWDIGDHATVKSPMLYPFGDATQNLRVWGVSCTQNDQVGTVTSVELVNDATFSMQFPDASKSSPYNQSATPAQPEGYT
jgi:prophage tail gpP-like protein